MMRAPLPRMHGLTLIELLVGLALTTMLLVAMTSMLQVSTAAGAASSAQLDLQEQAQFAVRRIARRIEQTPAAMLADKSDAASSANWLAPALFDLRKGTAPGTLALTETIGPVSTILAEPVGAFAITAAPVAAGRSVVTVALTLTSGDASASATVSVRLGALL
jgi:Tfp pilus assembly protein PilW